MALFHYRNPPKWCNRGEGSGGSNHPQSQKKKCTRNSSALDVYTSGFVVFSSLDQNNFFFVLHKTDKKKIFSKFFIEKKKKYSLGIFFNVFFLPIFYDLYFILGIYLFA